MTALAKREAANEVAAVERTRDNAMYVPKFDIWETDEELTLCGDMPGVSADDVDIRFENGQLIVHGKVPPRQLGAQFLYCEYGIGDYYRSFTIGEAIDHLLVTKVLRKLKDRHDIRVDALEQLHEQLVTDWRKLDATRPERCLDLLGKEIAAKKVESNE